MQLISFLIVACVILALLRMAIAALLIGLSIIILLGALYYPRETISFLMISAALGLMRLHPALSLLALCMGAMLHKE